MTRGLVVGLVLGLAACSGGEEEDEAGSGKPPVAVTVVGVVPVGKGEVADLLLASATVEAERAADVVPAATGIVKEVRRDVGDRVRAGEALAVLDNVTLDAGAERARADVAHLESQVAEVERLRAQGAASERELLDLRHQLETARTGLREATRTAGEARLVAPFDGVVAARELRVGELAQGAKRAFQVVDLSSLHVHARLPERDVARVRIGQTARLVSAYDEAATATAVVERVAPVIDATTGTFQVTLGLEPGQAALRPGQFVRVELEVDRHRDVVVVPKDAVRFEAGRPIAFVMVDAPAEPASEAKPAEGADTKPVEEGPRFVARRVEVELGLRDATSAEIVSGLAPGDRLVVEGASTLRDGARVRPPDAGKPADAAEAPKAPPASGG